MMQSTSLVYCPHPLTSAGRKVLTAPFRLGESIAAYLERQGVVFHQPVLLALDGETIPQEDWGNTYPRPGQVVAVRALVRNGGGGGSDPVRSLLQIAVSMAIMPVFGWGSLMTVSKVGGALIAGAFAVGAGALINAIAPIPQPNLARSGGLGLGASPTYSLAGSQNRARLYEPLPLVLGRHRMYPDAGAMPFTEYEGESQYLYQVFNFGFGALRLSDFKIGDTPLSSFQGVEYWVSSDDGKVPNFPGNVDTLTVSTALTYAASWQQRTGSANATQMSVDIAGQLFYTGKKGITTRSVTLDIEYRKVGDVDWLPAVDDELQQYTHYWSYGVYHSVTGEWVQKGYGSRNYADHVEGASAGGLFVWHWRPYSEVGRDPAPPGVYYNRVSQLVLTNGSSKPVRRTIRWTVDEGQYEVRVRRVTADETDDKAVSNFEWQVLRSYQPDTTDYTGQLRLGLRIRASGQLNGVIDQFNALVENWVPQWSSSGSYWFDGYTSNPAWLFLYFARGAFDADGRRLFGAGLPDARIDIEAIKEWGAWCTSKGLSFNGVLDRAMTCADVLAAIARCGRAAPTWATGKLGVVWEEGAKPITNTYGMANIKAGSFSIDYITDKLADEVIVRFINPELGYKPDTVRATVPGVTTPINPQTVDLFGCTDRTMAGKEALLIAASQYYHRRRITWEADLEGMVNQRGDVVLLSHDLTQWSYSGRLVAGTISVLELDRSVPFTEGQTHYVMLRHPNGTMETHAVQYVAGESSSLTLDGTTLSAEPDAGRPVDWLWFFAPMATPGKKARIVNIQPLDRDHVRITAVDEEAGYYAAEDGSVTYTAPTSFSELQPKISNLAVAEDLLDLSGLTRVHITWTPRNCTATRLRISIDGGPLEDYGQIQGASYALDLREGTRLYIEATPVALAMTSSIAPSVLSHTVEGLGAIPADLTGFAVLASNGYALLSWDQHPALDVRSGGYIRIRHTPKTSGATWSDGVDIGPAVSGSATSATLPLLSGTYMARAVDGSGNMSANAVMSVTTMPSVLEWNAVETVDEGAAGFLGSKSNVVYIDGALKLDSQALIDDMTDSIDDWGYIDAIGGISLSGEYVFGGSVDLGAVYSSRLTASIVALAFDANDLIDMRGYVDDWPSVDGDNVDDALVTLYVRTTDDDPAGSPTWSEWRQFYVGEWRARAYQFKAVFATEVDSHNVAVSGLAVTVDMPDRIEGARAVVVPAAGATISYGAAFKAQPVVGVTANAMATGDYFEITNETTSGFDVRFKNSGGTGVERTMNWTAKGYGKLAA